MKLLSFTILCILLCCFCISSTAQVQGETLIAGPTLGAITAAETPVFFAVENGNNASQFQVRIRESVSGIVHLPFENRPNCSGDTCAYVANFANLPLETDMRVYIYRNSTIDNQTLTEFKIPDNNLIQDFNFLIGSCAGMGAVTNPKEDIFPQMASEDAEFMLWMGDMIYLPSTDLDTFVVFDTYIRYVTQSPKRNQLYRSFFHFGIWDDHEYSYDNGTADYSDKGYVSNLFKHWLPSPNYEYPGRTGGIYHTYKYRDVEFFNTDVRYYRNFEKKLGKEQLDWLKQQLLQSNATFKFIQEGRPVLETRVAGTTETYLYQTGERQELFDFIYANNIEGVVFFTGDLHRSHFVKYNPNCNSTYPFYEFMSSPLSSGQSTATTLYAGAFYDDNSRMYGKISVSGPSGNRSLLLESKDVNGTVLGFFNINENELTFSGLADDDPATALHAHYPLDNTATDISGNGFNGTFTGTNFSATANRFQSTGDATEISIGGSQFKTLDLPNASLNSLMDVTVSIWVKPTITRAGLISAASASIGNELLLYYGAAKNFSISFKNEGLASKDTFDLNEWHHVVATRRGGTGLSQIYVNGIFQGEEIHPSGPLSVVSLLCLNDQDGAGGGNLDPNQQFYGEVDDLRIYNKSLCLYQIEALYNEGIPKLTAISSPVLCNPPVSATFGATGTTNGNYRWYYDQRSTTAIGNTNSTVTLPLLETTRLWVAPYTPWKTGDRIPVTIEVGSPIYTDNTGLTSPTGLIASYPINGNTIEETGSYGALSGSGTFLTTGMDGMTNGAVGFDSYPDILTVPSEMLDKAEQVSVSFWIKTTDFSCGVFSAAGPTTGNQIMLFISSTSDCTIYSNGGYRIFESTNLINDGNWHHVAITFDGPKSQVHPYIDGVHLTVAARGTNFRPGAYDIPPGALIFGNDQDTPGGGGYQSSQQFEGSLDEIKLYRRILTEEEIEQLAMQLDVVQVPFLVNAAPATLCEDDTARLQISPLQQGINYALADQNGVPVSANSYLDADTLVFEFPVTQSIAVQIVASDSVSGCTNDFTMQHSLTVVGCLELEAWLEGAFEASTALMGDDLRQLNLIPLLGANGPLNPELLTVNGPKAVVDWIAIELRDASAPATVVYSRSGVLLADGSIISEDGGGLMFPSTVSGSYYVVLKHRNHLPAMTASPITLPVSGSTAYSFKVNYGYNNNLGSSQTLLPTINEYGMFMGDGDLSSLAGYDLNGADLIKWQTENGSFNTYLLGDFNMDGDVNGLDKLELLPNNGVFSTVPR